MNWFQHVNQLQCVEAYFSTSRLAVGGVRLIMPPRHLGPLGPGVHNVWQEELRRYISPRVELIATANRFPFKSSFNVIVADDGNFVKSFKRFLQDRVDIRPR